MSNRYQNPGILLVIAVLLFSCADKKQTPESIAAQWCTLNGQVAVASEGAERDKALEARKSFEKRIEAKYRGDSVMMHAIFKAVEACEDASEGRKDKAVTDDDPSSLLPAAYSNATAAAEAYCTLINQSIAAAKNSNDAGLNKITAAKVLFEKNMEESYKDNAERRDSIFALVKPCMEKEVAFRSR
ncbi:hypothetical protein LQ567_15165 [Niabella pedocola]|uniref:Lipoprotein n=1 Tax=Niabella pedocola TaxID=1752077 RepID=A0ABS8PV04_9BACT|nr:hypothetical protein [Niabella pedocola]MCD2424118.1 hypothetical protein [Niabella pedocola]